MKIHARPCQAPAGLAFLSVLLATLACQILSPTPVVWSLSQTPQEAPPSVVATGTPSPAVPQDTISSPSRPTSTHTPSPVEEQVLPWIVWAGQDKKTLHALGPHGEQVELELPGPLWKPEDLSLGLGPGGEWLAFRTGTSESTGLALQLVHLPDGALTTIAPLLTPELEQAALLLDPPAVQAALAVTHPSSLAWSPDGRYLAYIAAAGGTSADLYLYEVRTQQSRRLTRGSNQAATPVWTPDSRWIIHQEVVTFDEGGGWKSEAVWVAAARHAETRQLYLPPEDSRGEVFLGWSSAGNLLVYSLAEVGGNNLRELPLSMRWTTPLYTRPFQEISYNPIEGWLVFTESESTGARARSAPGIYSLRAHSEDVQLIQAGEWEQLKWQAIPGRFIASGLFGALVFSAHGQTSSFQKEEQSLPSPDGQWVACWGDGLAGGTPGVRLYQSDGLKLQELSAVPATWLDWLPDSSGLVFQAEGSVYRALFPGAAPELLATGTLPGAVVLAH